MVYKIFIIRLLICFGLSLIIGIERQWNSKVGLRINILVCIGTYLFSYFALNNKEDGIRIIAQIISGIGFLGAGSIVTNDNEIKGLNTAATIWCVTAISILTSFGYIIEAVIGTILVFFSNVLFKSINHSDNRNNNIFYIKLKYNNNFDYLLFENSIANNIIYKKVRKDIFNRNMRRVMILINDISYNEMDMMVSKYKRDINLKYIYYGIYLF